MAKLAKIAAEVKPYEACGGKMISATVREYLFSLDTSGDIY